MNCSSKAIRFVIILNLLLASWAGTSPAADNAPPLTPTGRTEETNSQDMLRAYLQLQEQLHATQLAIERNRQEADNAAARSAEALNGRLQAIEQSLDSQRAGEWRAVQSSNRLMLILAGMFAAIGIGSCHGRGSIAE